jgi:hypothetical protein
MWNSVRFARRVFLIAGIYGLVIILPMYFFEDRIGHDQPPAITHPEFFYGFVGVTLAWQVAFLVIAGDPVRFRPLMLAALIEKASFVIAVLLLHRGGRVASVWLIPALTDLILGVLFVVAFLRTPTKSEPS